MKYLEGWKHVIEDMANHNELTDVKTINFPDLKHFNIDKQE